ncbi:hypothetical protein RB195_020006 [Necator americanus]|uniref:Uncharacterized protein n=1 Tax=Necator americanus TaxID=51031 RepID=A0ABR1CIP4_NECAM
MRNTSISLCDRATPAMKSHARQQKNMWANEISRDIGTRILMCQISNWSQFIATIIPKKESSQEKCNHGL